MEANTDEAPIDRRERLAATDPGPGIILLTASMRLLYKDRRARELCQQIIRGQDGKTANGVLQPTVADLADQVRTLLQARTDPKDWEQIQLRRFVNTLHSTVILCGTALIGQAKAENESCRDKRSRDWRVAGSGQGHRPGKGEISTDSSRNDCCATSLERLDQ